MIMCTGNACAGDGAGSVTNYYCFTFFHTNAMTKNIVAVNTIAAPEAMLR
jgi:hypothetical protein